MFDITQKFMIDPTKELSFAEFALKAQNLYGMDFLGIVTQYVEERDLEFELLDIMPRLAKIKHNKAQSRLQYAQSWIPCKVDTHACNKKISVEQGRLFDLLTDLYCLGVEPTEKTLEEARKTFESMDTPTLIFVPMVEWMRDKYDIEFKDKRLKKDE